jgi:hypothetical protein
MKRCTFGAKTYSDFVPDKTYPSGRLLLPLNMATLSGQRLLPLWQHCPHLCLGGADISVANDAVGIHIRTEIR